MQKITHTEISCQTACNKLKRKFPYQWDLNVYRGCTHGCNYCFALYTHQYMDSANFHNDIYIKTNIVEQLERQLSHPNWNREIINLGGITDNYQPAEAKYKLMPDILKLLIKYKTPAIICTKSDLPLRDFDLIDELSRITYINIASSIITTNVQIKEVLEPHSMTSAQRFFMLKEFRKTNASTGLHIMPIIPYLTDNLTDIETLLYNAHQSNVDYVLPGTLYLRGKTRPSFFLFLQETFPHLYQEFKMLYKTGSVGRDYKERFYEQFHALRNKYSLSSSYSAPIKKRLVQDQPKQLSFDDTFF